MRYKILVSISLLLLAGSSFTQIRNRDKHNPRYKIFLEIMDGRTIKGLLVNLEDSAIGVFPGSRSQWKNEETNRSQQIEYYKLRRLD